MSSTAIVSKTAGRAPASSNSPHGRADHRRAAVPGPGGGAAADPDPGAGAAGRQILRRCSALALVKAAVVLVAVLFVGQRLMRGWFHLVARRRSHELFMLNVLLITLGLAWLTELAGLSLALGAFLAGMLISETEYRYQVEEDIKPFRDVLLGLFFVTIGMLLDLARGGRQVRAGAAAVRGAAAVQVRADRRRCRACSARSRRLRCAPALALAQAGEFGFVLLALAGAASRLLDDALLQPVLAAMLLSMLAAPFLDPATATSSCCASSASDWMLRSLAAAPASPSQAMAADEARDHLRLRPQRPEPGALARAGEHRLHRARPRPGARARGRGGRRDAWSSATPRGAKC